MFFPLDILTQILKQIHSCTEFRYWVLSMCQVISLYLSIMGKTHEAGEVGAWPSLPLTVLCGCGRVLPPNTAGPLCVMAATTHLCCPLWGCEDQMTTYKWKCSQCYMLHKCKTILIMCEAELVNLNQSLSSMECLRWKSLKWPMDIVNLHIISLHRAGHGVNPCFLTLKSPRSIMVGRKLRGGLSSKSVSPNKGKIFLCVHHIQGKPELVLNPGSML